LWGPWDPYPFPKDRLRRKKKISSKLLLSFFLRNKNSHTEKGRKSRNPIFSLVLLQPLVAAAGAA